MPKGRISRKQNSVQGVWLTTLSEIRAGRYDFAALDQLIARTVDEVRQVVGTRHAAFGWSGGKDSLALEYVMRQAGVTQCLMGISALEYPAFLQWVTEHMPPQLTVQNMGQDLEWLARNQYMLFPNRADVAAKWFRIVQHAAQASYYRRENLDLIILGRRRADGNFLGPAGKNIYTNREGITRYSPLGEWTHEDVLATVVRYCRDEWPPIYGWPRGFQCGTHSWAARQFCYDHQHAWSEVAQIDRAIVIEAAQLLPTAARYLEGEQQP